MRFYQRIVLKKITLSLTYIIYTNIKTRKLIYDINKSNSIEVGY